MNEIMTITFKQFQRTLREDPDLARFSSVLATCQQALNLESAENEIRTLHLTRKARKLSSGNVSAPKLIDAVALEASTRSRLTELKLMIYRTTQLLTTHMMIARKHIQTEYRNEVRELSGTTKADREAFLDRLFPGARKLLDELESVETQIDVIVKDIDQVGYSMRELRELLSMILNKRESDL